MSTKRGRPAIKPSIRGLIFEYAINKKQMPRLALAVELQNLIEAMGELSPTEETMVKLISQARNHPVSDLDAPWSVGCLAQYDVPPEALPAVLSIYEKRHREWEPHFTIREALWIGRLYKVIDDPIFLERFASAYALRDKIDWILDNPVDTLGFDFKLLNYSNPSRRAEIVEEFSQFPASLDSFPSFHPNDSEEITKNLKQKGYDIEPLGMVLLRKHVAEVEKQAVQHTKQVRAQLEQKKPEELNEEEARVLEWAKRWLKTKEDTK